MTQENKELLLKDICARLPYEVMIDYESNIYMLNEIDPSCKDIDYITVRIQDVERLMCAKSTLIENIKPYLRPMSSMTEEEIKELLNIDTKRGIFSSRHLTWHIDGEIVDYLNKKMFDWRRLIPKGLAIEVTKENNPYK